MRFLVKIRRRWDFIPIKGKTDMACPFNQSSARTYRASFFRQPSGTGCFGWAGAEVAYRRAPPLPKPTYACASRINLCTECMRKPDKFVYGIRFVNSTQIRRQMQMPVCLGYGFLKCVFMGLLSELLCGSMFTVSTTADFSCLLALCVCVLYLSWCREPANILGTIVFVG